MKKKKKKSQPQQIYFSKLKFPVYSLGDKALEVLYSFLGGLVPVLYELPLPFLVSLLFKTVLFFQEKNDIS